MEKRKLQCHANSKDFERKLSLRFIPPDEVIPPLARPRDLIYPKLQSSLCDVDSYLLSTVAAAMQNLADPLRAPINYLRIHRPCAHADRHGLDMQTDGSSCLSSRPFENVHFRKIRRSHTQRNFRHTAFDGADVFLDARGPSSVQPLPYISPL